MTARSFQRPPVTVLMPVYNGARFLDEAIESIRNQTFADFEFLIIDDGSHDTTPEILRRHAAEDRRIRVISQENRGLIDSLNRGFEEARGEFIARMDADDVARFDRLAQEVTFLQSHPDIALVGSAIEVTDAHGRHIRTIRYPEEPGEIRRYMREIRCVTAHPAVVFRRRAALEAGGLRHAYRHAEDYDLWLRMIEKHDFANLPDTLLFYRRHDGSISSIHVAQQVLSTFCARLTAKLRREGIPDPTANAALITPGVVWSLGVSPQTLDAEMFRSLREATELEIDCGRRSAAVEFFSIARPFADPAQLRETVIELNRRAAQAPAPAEEQSRHRRMLLDADAAIYRAIFGSSIRTSTTGGPGAVSGKPPIKAYTLAEIHRRDRYDIDKGGEYLPHYEHALAHLCSSPIALLKIGVSRDGSLYLWRDYFANGLIVGVDSHPPGDFTDPSGRCYLRQSDQGDLSSLQALASATAPAGFHIIIDDASYLGARTALTFEALFYNHLRPGGFYAIEDWDRDYWEAGTAERPAIVPPDPGLPNAGQHFPSHDIGMAGFVKHLVDKCASPHNSDSRVGGPERHGGSIRSIHIVPGLVIVEKRQE